MADIAIFRINYKSDFILTLNSDAGWMTPFCIKFWTGAPSQAYFAGYDGTTYTHCAPVEGDPTKLVVQFDDHHLPVGDLTFQIGYHFTVADFPTSVEDEVLNQASVIIEQDGEPAQVMLDFNGETAPEIEFSLPAYANEAQRIANEQARIEAEQQRIANEDARIQAEETRQQNEQQRIAHETNRINEFATLKSQSQAATSAANTAATLANEKAQLAADKAALAQAAATLANDKAQLAADKAALAQAAATLANDKAALAQQKAAYAQTQGDYAKAQGDYAKAQGDTAQADHERAEADHATAASDHSRAESDHTTAASDHSRAETDHTTAASDHSRAETDHTTAASDHSRAESDHTTAAADHSRAESDHTTAAADHETAASDHTRAESDHAAVEVYVDSLGAFDISSYHATGGVLAKYADLSAALGTDGANIPEGIRKGGMSVKFVQSSDNKYVQYRLMHQNWSVNPSDWQSENTDDIPTEASGNLVSSFGIYRSIDEILKYITLEEIPTIYCEYTNWSGTGKIEKVEGNKPYKEVDCQKGDVFFLAYKSISADTIIWNIIDSEGNLIRRSGAYQPNSSASGIIIIPDGGSKLIVRAFITSITSAHVYSYLYRGINLGNKVADIDSKLLQALPRTGIIKPDVENIEGKYIYINGTINPVSGGVVTSPFNVKKGDVIKVKCSGFYNDSSHTAIGCIIAKCTGENETTHLPTGITPLVLASTNDVIEYTYTADQDTMLCVSYRQYDSTPIFAKPAEITIYRDLVSGFLPIQQGAENNGKYLAVGIDGNIVLVDSTTGTITVDNAEKYVLYQKLKNGTFDDGLDNWTAAPAINVSVENGALKINTQTGVQVRQSFAEIASGHKIYISYDAWKAQGATVYPWVCLGNASASFQYNYEPVLTETKQMFSHLVEPNTNITLLTFARNTTNGGIYYVDNVVIYDVTEIFGAGNEPTLSECDEIFHGTTEYSIKEYVDMAISTIHNIQENQLSEQVQIKLNSGGGGGTSSKWIGAKLGCLGDSITAIDNNLKKYYRYMQDFYTLSGVSVAAISGATISSYSNPFYNRVTDLAADCDLVVMLGGINDFNHSIPLGELYTTDASGEKTATSDTSTFYGALHTTVQALINRFPTKVIVLMTPLHSGGFNNGSTVYPSDQEKNSANKYLIDYVNAIKEVGEWYSIPVLDLYSVAGFNPNISQFVSEYFSSVNDLLHPNTKGHALIANRIEGFLNAIG